ncbi:MAG: glycogen/starch/alpha-glucan phosphorylase [Faecalibacterium sp.]|nr:glycogen/starch/alpha-glucan phosphorylase [Ruminococcus sp.]MCM1393004.1 glycogen/starch/alpha-glucan phosphorylase [Ruminococcus sp.]MCM1486514.1 glycogen/starch/alpha-glucan phosphorylase [Faecalibacterium sp.]
MNYSLTKKQAKELISGKLSHYFGVSTEEATDEQYYKAVALIIKDLMHDGLREFRAKSDKSNSKKIYYLSMEFLMGRSLKNNLYNLNLTKTFASALKDFGINLEKLYDCEPDAGLGNGGLGRLAACYLDGLATQGYNGMGYSILYECGIFKQKLIDGWQTELPDFWLPGGEVWLTPREQETVEVSFGGYVHDYWDNHYHAVEVEGDTKISAVPYDMFVSGKDGKSYSVLRLWKSKAPSLDMRLFDQGQYMKAMEQQAMAEVISKILYPSDNHPEGKSLRLKQQYFLVSASIQDIVKRHLRHHSTMENFAETNAVHINDTHPTLSIPELMRILLDECGYGWDDAWKIVINTMAYTNHTVMKEALECWSEDLFRTTVPRIYQIVKEIDNRYRAHIWNTTGDAGKVEEMAVIANGVIRMANLCVAACHSVNGVSALHSQILKDSLFNSFYQLTPNKFKNVTNGIAHRRWLCQSNPELSEYIASLIGDGFIYNADELSKLAKFADDKKVLAEIDKIKLANKKKFAAYLKKERGITIDPNSIFDVQVKRLHEYKRQHLNALQILAKYLEIKANPNGDYVPHTYIFGAKAASGYFVAKKIIELIYAMSELINNDPDVNGKLKVVYLEDYNVTMAERLMPAADISEQISLAGTEASGTGNMKLMLNGAITLGTLDGANVEIHEAVGDDNMILFGMTTPEVNNLKATGYQPMNYFNNNAELRRVIEFIQQGFAGKEFPEIGNTIIHHDPYMVLADFADYRNAQKKIDALWADRKNWSKMSLLNIAGAGRFAADRAINDYARDIWNTAPVE